MPITTEQLTQLKKDIDQAKLDLSNLEGKKETYMEELETKWKCGSVEEAQKKLDRFDKKIKSLGENIETAKQELEEKYEIN